MEAQTPSEFEKACCCSLRPSFVRSALFPYHLYLKIESGEIIRNSYYLVNRLLPGINSFSTSHAIRISSTS
jgi:hypothetical protein